MSRESVPSDGPQVMPVSTSSPKMVSKKTTLVIEAGATVMIVFSLEFGPEIASTYFALLFSFSLVLVYFNTWDV